MAEKATDVLRITNQSRSKTGYVYDLRCEGFRLILSIAPRENAGDEGEFRAEARPSTAPDCARVSGWGATRELAVKAAGEEWLKQAEELGLAKFDWDAVVRVLSDVRAI